VFSKGVSLLPEKVVCRCRCAIAAHSEKGIKTEASNIRRLRLAHGEAQPVFLINGNQNLKQITAGAFFCRDYSEEFECKVVYLG
jgi:hypothetical protein